MYNLIMSVYVVASGPIVGIVILLFVRNGRAALLWDGKFAMNPYDLYIL